MKNCGIGLIVCHWRIFSLFFCGFPSSFTKRSSTLTSPIWIFESDLRLSEKIHLEQSHVLDSVSDIHTTRTQKFEYPLSQVPSPGMHLLLLFISAVWFIQYPIFTATNKTCLRMHWSEGSSLAMQGGGVEHLGSSRYTTIPTKFHGSWPQGDLGQDYGRSSITVNIKKRSLRRAYRRLETQGHTWYRGQFWQKQITLPVPPDFKPRPKSVSTSQPLEHVPRNRLIVFHWNGGALSSARYHELLQWLTQQRVDIAIISETHWSYTAEWQTTDWHAIHSGHEQGKKDKASGLLVLVATRLCRPDQIVWREVEADCTYSQDPLTSLVFTSTHGVQLLSKNLSGSKSGTLWASS